MLSVLRPITRWVLVASQGTTLALTWPLWLCRDDPPLVHRFDLPAWDAGPLLVASLVAVLIPDLLALLRRPGPRWLGPLTVAVHALALGLAMAQDELRIQPQVIVPALLLFATLPGDGARLFGLGVLASMWGWAGLHKILSERYLDGFGSTVVGPLFPGLPEGAIAAVCRSISYGELAMGLCVLAVPFTRWGLLRWGLVAAGLGLHGTILLSLWKLGHNPSVWPWNISSAVAAAWLIATTRSPFVAHLRTAGWVARAGVLALLAVPTGFYFGLTHPYFAFSVYSSNTPQATVENAMGREFPMRYIKAFESFIPPTHRNYRTIFLHRCRPGEQLIITDDRGWAQRNDRERVVVRYGDDIDP